MTADYCNMLLELDVTVSMHLGLNPDCQDLGQSSPVEGPNLGGSRG